MKYGLNKVTLVGNVGEDPKVNQTGDNGMFVTLSVATNDYYKDKEGNEQKVTEWHKVVAWHKLAEIIRDYVKKGDPLYIEGRLKTNSWESKEGVKKYSTEIQCDNFLFLSAKNT